MSQLHLICGLPGSGKSTLARKLEAETSAIRLTPDEWLIRLRFDGYDEAARATIETIQWDFAQRLLALGVDVILESGFWSRVERMRFKARAEQLGATTRLHFLNVPRDELLRRLALRNQEAPDLTVPVDPRDLDRWIAQFEVPTADELE